MGATLTVLATLNHMDQEVRVIFTIDVTLVTIFVSWLFLLVHLHVFFIGEVPKALWIGAFDSPRSRHLEVESRDQSIDSCFGRQGVLSESQRVIEIEIVIVIRPQSHIPALVSV